MSPTEALRLANQTRVARSQLKAKIKAGKTTAAKAIANPPERCERMAVMDVLLAQPQWGRRKCARFCRALQVYERRPLEDLTKDQRERLIDELGKA